MTRIRIPALALAALLTACGGSEGGSPTDPPAQVVTSVTVTPASQTVDQGATLQFQASAKDQSGNTMSGQTVTWSSSNIQVATISGSGLATAVAAGTSAITATVGGVAGSAVLTVAQSVCANPKTVALSPGQAQAYAASDCILLPSGASGDRYRVTLLRSMTSGTAEDVVTATLKVTGVGVSQLVPMPSPIAMFEPLDGGIPGLDAPEIRRGIRIAEATSRFHNEMRDKEERLMREVGLENLVVASTRSGPARVVAQADSPSKITLDTSTGSDCTTSAAAKKTALKIYETDDLVFYQDSTQNATDPFTVANASKMASYYTTHSKQMIIDYFGKPSDIDNNGKVVVFVTPIVKDDVAAFVWSGDFFTTSSCASSNERELIYFNHDIIKSMDNGVHQALETLAHEMKHVVSIYNRIAASRRAGSSQYHPQWVEEGTAEIAGEMSARIAWASIGGPAVNAQVTRNSFVNTAGNIVPENYGIAIKLARTAWYLSGQPNGLVVTPTGAPDGASVYGSGWLFHRWLGDAHGNAASAPKRDATLFRALNDSLAGQGSAGIAGELGVPFLDLLQQFAVAVTMHKATTASVPRDFTSYEFTTAAEIFCTPNPLGVFPWPVTTTGTPGDCNATPRVTEQSTPTVSFRTAQYSGSMGPTGMRIHDFLSNGTGTGAQIQVTMPEPAKVIVTRLR